MSKKELKLWLVWVSMLLTLLLMSSCLGSKKTAERNSSTIQKETSEVKKDSVATIETNQPIKDNIVINVPKSDNEVVNKALEAILQQLNTSKTSGTNSYVSRYDADTNRLLIEFLIGQTQNKVTETNTDVKEEKSFEQKTDEYISKKVKAIPWWVIVIVILWFLPQIIERVKFILNPLSQFIKWPKKE